MVQQVDVVPGLDTIRSIMLSGKRAALEVEAEASVESLKRRAQSALAVAGSVRLLDSSGEVLDGTQLSRMST